ncbi:hypothetical protein PanWU01x14_079500 [Parasponia andersonii]|uniref:Uncharacterized protein n=1 Tax=Parasponia andersonii TaxID=3476 RepID=A0A2P5DBA3_PARAD|nr:hypothetical protein PanWU01x14_079500 [Parasponia andersonii]
MVIKVRVDVMVPLTRGIRVRECSKHGDMVSDEEKAAMVESVQLLVRAATPVVNESGQSCEGPSDR